VAKSARRPAAPRPAPKPERGSRATNRLVILLLVVGALVISFGSSLRAYLRQSDQIHQLEAQIATAQASIAASKEQQKRWQDPSYIEQQARLRFGWVMPGQTPYVVLGPNGQPLNTKAELDAQPPSVSTTPVSWWSKEASSWQAADNPAPPSKKPAPAKRITGQ
jgi:cell division protein FtsB